MRTVVKDEKSEWIEVKSRVSQGSVLAPIMFLIYVNDMTGVSSYISLEPGELCADCPRPR